MNPTTRSAWIVLGGLMFATAVPATALAGVDLLGRRAESTITTYEMGAARLDISTDGRVEIQGSTDNMIRLERRVIGGLRHPKASATLDGSTLRLRGSCPSFGTFCSVDYTVRVPRSMRVEATSSGGSITVSSVAGPVSVDSSGGSITLVALSGAVTASSSGGSIGGRELRSPKVSAESSGGGVRVSFAAAPTEVSVSSSGGGVRVEVPRGEELYRTDASSSGGSSAVEIRTDPSSPRTITARSSGGSVRVAYRS